MLISGKAWQSCRDWVVYHLLHTNMCVSTIVQRAEPPRAVAVLGAAPGALLDWALRITWLSHRRQHVQASACRGDKCPSRRFRRAAGDRWELENLYAGPWETGHGEWLTLRLGHDGAPCGLSGDTEGGSVLGR